MTQGSVFIFGLGYSAQAIARAALASGWAVGGSTRNPQLAEDLRQHGIAAEQWSGEGAPLGLQGATHVISSVPPKGGDVVLNALRPRDLHGKAGVIYLSSTSVYGDQQGAWVDETTPCDPVSGPGRARLTAESDWAALCAKAGVPLTVLRLAGIYGPGRSALDRLRAGTARRIVKPGQAFSRIHVDDIARATLAALARPEAAPVLNICDDFPSPPQDVVTYGAELLNMTPPPEEDFDSADLSPMARFFFADSKLVRNDLAKTALGLSWRYPDYRTGLRAILEAERTA